MSTEQCLTASLKRCKSLEKGVTLTTNHKISESLGHQSSTEMMINPVTERTQVPTKK